jgi:hypothetical protein
LITIIIVIIFFDRYESRYLSVVVVAVLDEAEKERVHHEVVDVEEGVGDEVRKDADHEHDKAIEVKILVILEKVHGRQNKAE